MTDTSINESQAVPGGTTGSEPVSGAPAQATKKTLTVQNGVRTAEEIIVGAERVAETLAQRGPRIWKLLSGRKAKRITVISIILVAPVGVIGHVTLRWLAANVPGGPFPRPDVPTVMVVARESRDAGNSAMKSEGACRSMLTSALERTGTRIGGTGVRVWDTREDMLEALGFENWWSVWRPVHVLIWAEAKATYLGSRQGDAFHNWKLSFNAQAIDVSSGVSLGSFDAPSKTVQSNQSTRLESLRGEDPFEGLIAEAADELAGQIKSAWASRR